LFPVGRVNSNFEVYCWDKAFLPFSSYILRAWLLKFVLNFEVLTLGLSPDESIKESQHHEEEQKPEPE
jgi:hypothetical protein